MKRIQYEDVFFYPIVILPTKNFVIEKERIESYTDDFLKLTNIKGDRVSSAFENDSEKYRTIVHNGGLPSSYVVGEGTTVDGILVESYQPNITSYGILDYTGKNKPILSIDRIKIIQYPTNNDAILKNIESIFKQKYQELVEKHVNQYHLDDATKENIENLHFHSSFSYQEEDSCIRRPLRI